MTENTPKLEISPGYTVGGSTTPINGPAVLGWLMIIFGVGLMAWGFGMDASVEVSSYSALGPERINNIGLMNTKLMLVIAGGAVMVSGSVFAARRA